MQYRLKLSEPVEMYFEGYDEPLEICQVFIDTDVGADNIDAITFIDTADGGYSARELDQAPEAQEAIAGLKALAESLQLP